MIVLYIYIIYYILAYIQHNGDVSLEHSIYHTCGHTLYHNACIFTTNFLMMGLQGLKHVCLFVYLFICSITHVTLDM